MNPSPRPRRWLLVAGLLAAAVVVAAGAIGPGTVRPVSAAPDTPDAPNLDLPLPNLWVNTTNLTADPSDNKCDLWEALQAVFQANYGLSPTYNNCTAKVGGMNIIGFSVVGGTITVPASGSTADLPFVHGETVIVGPITIAGAGGSADTHLLRTAPGAKLTVAAVTLKNGRTSGAGAAIYSDNYATVNVIASFLIGNYAANYGGAIYSNGDLNLMGTSFINNTTGSTPGRGGAVYVTGLGKFNSQATTYTNNKAAAGGALYLEKSGGHSSLSESIFTANSVSADANGFGGGAVYNASTGGTLEINRTAFNGNFSTQGAGGAIVNKISASTTISNSLFDANVAGDSTHARNGGAIYNQGPLSIVKSTLVLNVAEGGSGGGLATESNGAVTIGNATFHGNVADGQGGAIYGTASAVISVRNSTFSANNSGGQGGIVYLGGTATGYTGNTIFDGTATLTPNCAGNAFISLGHNLDTGTTCAANSGLGDLQSNPLLGALSFNGGSLPVLTTQVPDYASLAIDHGDWAICSHPSVDKEDETGAARPKNGSGVGAGACDIGAVEVDERKPAFDAEPMPPGPLNFGSVQINHTVTTTFTVHNAGNYSLTLSNPVMGDAAHFSVQSPAFPIGLGANQTKSIVLACTPTLENQVSTTFTFATTDPDRASVAYTLICTGKPTPVPAFASNPIAPGPIEFGEVTIGELVTQTITVINNGTAALVVNQPGFSSDGGNFAYTFSAMNIGAGNADQFTVRCQPNRVGALTGQIILQTNDASQSAVSYNLNCHGVPPQSAYLVNASNLKNPFLPGDISSLFGVATSPDGLNAYVNGNTATGGEVVVLKKSTSGLLAGSYLWSTQVTNDLLTNPHELKVSPDGQYLLVTGGTDNALGVYARDGGNGSLTPVFTLNNLGGLNNPYGVAFSPDSQFAYVTNYTGNSISTLQRIGGGYFAGTVVTATTMTTHTLQNPAGIVVSPDGKHVYVAVHTATASQGTLAAYRRDAATGALTPIQTRYQGDCQDGGFFCLPVTGLASAYQLAISPDGNNVYVTSWYNHAVANFRRDAVTGLLHWNGTIGNSSVGGSGLTNAFGVAVSPDNLHVYVTSYSDDTLVMFDRDKANGYLSFREKYQRDPGTGAPALNGAFQTAVSSDGGYVFAVGQSDNAVAVFRLANPQPTMFSLQPASVAQGSGDFTLVVKGSGFVDGASLWWDGSHPADTFVNSSELRATIPASYLTSAGDHSIMIHNPTPGGGDSFNTLVFKVIAPAATPVPSIDHLSPAGVVAGASGVQVDVYGSNFQSSGSTVTANGSGVTRVFIDSTHLRITAFNVNTFAQPGTVNIQVNNLGGVQSNIVGLDVAAPGQNPVPSITALSRDWVWSLGAGSPNFTLSVFGTNFVDGAVVQWNGEDRPTKFISQTELAATISGSDQLDPATNSLSVKNPAPGGGQSNVLTFIVRPLFQLLLPMVRN